MTENALKVNPETNGLKCNRELERLVERICDDNEVGLLMGIDANGPHIRALRSVLAEAAIEDGTVEGISEICVAFGSHLTGLQKAGGDVTSRDIAEQASLLAAEISNSTVFDSGLDIYDIAWDAVHQGSEYPRTDISGLIQQSKAERIEVERNAELAKLGQFGKMRLEIEWAIEAHCAGDPGALFGSNILWRYGELRKYAVDDFQRVRAKIAELGSDVLAQLDDALHRKEEERREKAKREEAEDKLYRAASAAKSGRAGQVANEAEEANKPLDARTAFEYGTSPDFDHLDEEMGGEVLRRMNREFSLVPVGGDVRALEITEDDKFILHRLEALRQRYENVRLAMRGKAQPVNAFDVWMQWPGRKTYNGVSFCPGSTLHPPDVPKGHFNTWRGYALTPKEGSWPLLHTHLLNVVCSNDEQLLCWFLDWIAQLLQEPQRKPGTAVVLRSSTEGTGKSLVGYVMRSVLGTAVLSASRADQVAGRFNAHLREILVLIAEEALYAGSKSNDGVLKDMITCDSMAYEAKGLPVVVAPNYTRVMFISNEHWVVPAGATSRRYAVFDCDNDRANDRKYFEPLFCEIDSGGAAAFLHDMLKREITSDLRRPPITKGLLEQREMSLDGFSKWLINTARNGEVRIPDRDFTSTVDLGAVVDVGQKISLEDLRLSVEPHLDPYERRSMDQRLGKLLKDVGARKCRLPKSRDGSRPWGYEFPPINEFRTAVGHRLGVSVEAVSDEGGADHEAMPSTPKVIPIGVARRAARSIRASVN